MSQFFGCIDLKKKFNLKDVAQRMTSALDFFQPDAIDVYQTEEVFICNKFLFNTPESIYTTSICQNDRYVLAASCRLDNREEIAAKIQLQNPGEKSDHDYLVAAYTFYQEKCVEHLLGDFSFVVWDKEKKTLFMAKDHIGIKPLYYYLDENILVFSTYIQGIKAVEGINLSLDKLYIARELKNFSPTFEDTFFEHIKRLKPAHFIQFIPDAQHLHQQKYWELTPLNVSAFQTEEEIYAEFRRLLTEAVVCRTRTHKNIGCQLSGGLDSSAITVLLSRNLDKNRLHTYSFVLNDKTRAYSERGIDEQETQNTIIEYADLKRENHHKIEDFHYKDVLEELDISNLIMGGYSSTDAIWQDTLFKRAGENRVGFMMSGFPGDECVSNSGNLYFYDYLGNRNWKELVRLIQTEKIKGLRKIASYFKAKYHGTYKINYREIQKHRDLLHPDSEYNKLLKTDTEAFKFYPTFKAYLKNQIGRSHICHRLESEGLYALQYGIETTYPLADIRLIQFVYSLPSNMFAPAPFSRRIFRTASMGILPDTIRLQEKRSFALPFAFGEYWREKQLTYLKRNNYTLENTLLIDENKEIQGNGFYKSHFMFIRYKLDYLIRIN